MTTDVALEDQRVNVTGDLNVDGGAQIGGTANIHTIIANEITASGAIDADKLHVTKSAVIDGSLQVNALEFRGKLTAEAATFGGGVEAKGLSIHGDAGVEGTFQVHGTTSIGPTLEVAGTLLIDVPEPGQMLQMGGASGTGVTGAEALGVAPQNVVVLPRFRRVDVSSEILGLRAAVTELQAKLSLLESKLETMAGAGAHQ